MTFTIRRRGALGSVITAEYVCPKHGRFSINVERTCTGDAPDSYPCPAFNSCDSEMESVRDWPTDKPCGLPATWTPSPPRLKFPYATAAVKGRPDEQPSPYHMNTESLADDPDSLPEFRAGRDRVWRDWRDGEIKKAVS